MKRRSILKGIGAAGLATVVLGTASADVPLPGHDEVHVRLPEEGTAVKPDSVEPLGDGGYRVEFAGDRDSVTIEPECTIDCCFCPCKGHCDLCGCNTMDCTC